MSDKINTRILVVDDDEQNIDIIIKSLPKDYDTKSAVSAEQAIAFLHDETEHFDIVILDRMMDGKDGIEVLKEIKKTKRLEHIPVIFQTAKTDPADIAEGIKEGAFYYVTKPFEKELLVSIVEAADDFVQQSRFKEQEDNTVNFGVVSSLELKLKSFTEIRKVGVYLANLYPNKERALFGIHEMIMNALEHGNLGIGYQLKTDLLKEKRWQQEIEKRLALPENKDKCVEIRYVKKDKTIELYVKDQGDGFEWDEYFDISPLRVSDNHGRGIAISKSLSFDEINYIGSGNEVCCIVNI